MPKIELIYFNIHAGVRGLLPRMVLKFGDVEYEETLATIEDWKDLKPSKI